MGPDFRDGEWALCVAEAILGPPECILGPSSDHDADYSPRRGAGVDGGFHLVSPLASDPTSLSSPVCSSIAAAQTLQSFTIESALWVKSRLYSERSLDRAVELELGLSWRRWLTRTFKKSRKCKRIEKIAFRIHSREHHAQMQLEGICCYILRVEERFGEIPGVRSILE